MGEVSLSYTSISINHKIIEFFSKALYKSPGLVISVVSSFRGGDPACRVCKIGRIILKGKILEVFLFQDIPDIRLGIKEINGGLSETGAFFPVYIAGIFTDRAVIVKLQIIGGKSVLQEKSLPLPGQSADSRRQIKVFASLDPQDKAGFLKPQSGDLPPDLSQTGNPFLCQTDMLVLLMLMQELFLVIVTHDRFVLKIFQ